MTVMKKLIALLLAVALTLPFIAGCGAEKDAATETALAAPLDDPYSDWDFEPLFWKATSPEGGTLYLFGTIHLGDDRSESVLSRLDPYLAECGALAVEFDVVAYSKSPEAMLSVYQYTYKDGSKVSDHVSPELYEKMKSAVEDAGYPVQALEMYDLSIWEQLLTEVYMEESPLSTEFAMDSMLINRANERDIPVRDLESAEFQMSLLSGLSEEIQIMLIESILASTPKQYAAGLTALYSAWLSGVEMAMEDDLAGEIDSESAALYEEYNEKLLAERNRGMAEKASAYLDGGERVFFAVGAGHFVGDDGIVSLLRGAGYDVERIYLND